MRENGIKSYLGNNYYKQTKKSVKKYIDKIPVVEEEEEDDEEDEENEENSDEALETEGEDDGGEKGEDSQDRPSNRKKGKKKINLSDLRLEAGIINDDQMAAGPLGRSSSIVQIQSTINIQIGLLVDP
mmetsp:Transcript_2662/g.2534  ORF Transcript_2662/g.2534 Transcript_2662/m.2534 type:complete len:128 (-) Transcript_2662:583-966(-)